jgi:glycosyltransferase A (GT-A) superfamily protein (DUF2064 family)
VSVGPALRSEGEPPKVLIAAKAPVPGNVKTRLSPPLSPELAARLAGAFLADVLAAARAVDPGAGILCPPADAAALRERFPGTPTVEQAGAGLTGALATGLATGAVVVAGDAPAIRSDTIAAAVASTAELVLAPSHDGGFGLIRLRGDAAALFAGIAWSTGSVLDQTVAAGRALGLRAELLESVPDVDTAADLAGLDLSRAAATRAVLDAARWDPAHVPGAPGVRLRP